MRIEPTKLPGAYLIRPDVIRDARGFFARTYCERQFSDIGITAKFVQCNISYNEKKGTIRGLHFQAPPAMEPKLVRCTKGRIFDVIVDLRPHSPRFCKWQGFELSEANREALYIPVGFAHGFQTLDDATEVFYQMGEFFVPELARGVRWNDPAFGIAWPIEASIVISEKDESYADFSPSKPSLKT